MITANTAPLAITSALLASLSAACCKATSASSTRPRWSSATAWLTRLVTDDVDGACANSSKT